MIKRHINGIFYAAIAAVLLCAVSCIRDNGNYNYTEPEVPAVKIDSLYNVNIGAQLVIAPEITFSDKTQLAFTWTIWDPNQMKEHVYEGAKLDIVFTLKAQLYSAMLTVTDNRTKMKYFYPFNIQGATVFSRGIVLLTSSGGQSKLTFIQPDGTVMENLYELMNGGESLPAGPKQIVPVYHQYMLGGIYLGYWIVCSDKNNPGIQIDVNTMTKIKTFRENFLDVPEGEVSAMNILPKNDNGTTVGVIDGRFYVGRFESYFEFPGYGFYSTPIAGDYLLSPHVAVDAGNTFYWCYNILDKSLVCFIPPAGMIFYAEHLQGPPVTWNPRNVGLDLISFMSCPSGFFLFGKDENGDIQELRFNGAGQNVMSTYKDKFAHKDLIRDDTKWLLSILGEIYFSSGNKVYHYNPNSRNIDVLAASIQGDITMLKAGKEMFQLIVGSENRLYWLDITPGQNGQIIKTVEGFSGQPVDLFEKDN